MDEERKAEPGLDRAREMLRQADDVGRFGDAAARSLLAAMAVAAVHALVGIGDAVNSVASELRKSRMGYAE